MRRNLTNPDRVDISLWFFTEVRLICELRVLIPVAGEYALSARTIESNSKATNSAEEVNEFEFVSFLFACHAMSRCRLAVYQKKYQVGLPLPNKARGAYMATPYGHLDNIKVVEKGDGSEWVVRSLLPGLQPLALQVILITILQILRPVGRQVHPRVIRVDEFFLIQIPDREFEVLAGAADHALQLD